MDIRAVRKKRLEQLIAEATGIHALSERCNVSEKYLRQILSGFRSPGDRNARSIGHDVARRLESGMNKPPGWMDQPLNEALPPELAPSSISDEAMRIARVWDTLPKPVRENILALIDFAATAAAITSGKNPSE